MEEYLPPHIMAYSQQQCTISIPSDVIERCDSSFDIRNFSNLSLLRAVLAIRSCGGRYKRAYKALEDVGIPIPIVVYVVKKICKILGCGNLDTNIPHEDTIRAFDQFLQLQHPDGQYQTIHWPSPNVNHNNHIDFLQNPNLNDRYPSLSNYIPNYYENLETNGYPGSGYTSHNGSFHVPNNHGFHGEMPQPSISPHAGLNPNAAAFSFNESNSMYKQMSNDFYRSDSLRSDDMPYLPQVPYHNQNAPNFVSNQGNMSPQPIYEQHQHETNYQIEERSPDEPLASNIFIPNRPVDIHMHILQLLLPEINVDTLIQKDSPSAPSRGPSRGRQQSVAFQPDLQSVCQLFWILSICVFLTVCDDRQPIEESLARLHELCQFVGSGNSDLLTMSPVIGVALDVIVQRAVYELSDKIALQSVCSPNNSASPMSDVSESKKSHSNDSQDNEQLSTDETKAERNDSIFKDGYSNPQVLYDTIHSDSEYARDLYRCISLMLHSVTESCVRIENSFLPGSNNSNMGSPNVNSPALGSPGGWASQSGFDNDNSARTPTKYPTGLSESNNFYNTQTSMNSRTQKLAKQLREALAWSSCRDQLPLESQVAYSRIQSTLSGSTQVYSPLSLGDIDETLSMKYKSVDTALVQLISGCRHSDALSHDVEQTRLRVQGQLFHFASSMGPNSEYQDGIVELGGLSGTPLLSCFHGQIGGGQLKASSSNNSISSMRSNMGQSNAGGSTGSVVYDVEFTLNIPSFNQKIQSFKNQILALQNKLNTFQDILRIDTAIENCLKHIKACIKEARNQMSSYYGDLQAYSQIYSKKFYNNAPQGRGGRGRTDSDMTSKIARVRAEMETLCSIGDKLISVMGNNLRSLRSTGIPGSGASRNATLHLDTYPIISNDFDTLAKLPTLLQSRRYVTDELSKLVDAETNELKRYLRTVEQVIRDAQYPGVKLIVRPKHPGVRFGPWASSGFGGAPLSRTNTPGGPGYPLSRTITPSNGNQGGSLSRTLTPANPGGTLSRTLTPTGPNPNSMPWSYIVSVNDSGLVDPYLQMSSLYNTYINYDRTNKLRYYLSCIGYFTKVHSLCDPDGGTLSMEGWLVLALHVLLRKGIIPNLHENQNNRISPLQEEIYEGRTEHSSMSSQKNILKLEDYSLIGLLELFYRYYTEDFDILGSIVTLRGKGEIISKSSWRIESPVLWRLCVEDPFEKSVENPTRPYDLGGTLTRPGQIQLFKALRRAAYGIHAIVIKDIVDTEKHVRMLFHKDDLLALSRMSGYNGAAVINTPIYIPNPNWKSKIIHIWSSDQSIHSLNVGSEGNLASRQNSRDVFSQSRLVQSANNSGNSLLEEFSPVERNSNVINSSNNSFGYGNQTGDGYPPYIDPSIRIIDAVYEDSESDDESGNHQEQNAGFVPGNQPTRKNSNSQISFNSFPADNRPGPPSIIVPGDVAHGHQSPDSRVFQREQIQYARPVTESLNISPLRHQGGPPLNPYGASTPNGNGISYNYSRETGRSAMSPQGRADEMHTRGYQGPYPSPAQSHIEGSDRGIPYHDIGYADNYYPAPHPRPETNFQGHFQGSDDLNSYTGNNGQWNRNSPAFHGSQNNAKYPPSGAVRGIEGISYNIDNRLRNGMPPMPHQSGKGNFSSPGQRPISSNSEYHDNNLYLHSNMSPYSPGYNPPPSTPVDNYGHNMHQPKGRFDSHQISTPPQYQHNNRPVYDMSSSPADNNFGQFSSSFQSQRGGNSGAFVSAEDPSSLDAIFDRLSVADSSSYPLSPSQRRPSHSRLVSGIGDSNISSYDPHYGGDSPTRTSRVNSGASTLDGGASPVSFSNSGAPLEGPPLHNFIHGGFESPQRSYRPTTHMSGGPLPGLPLSRGTSRENYQGMSNIDPHQGLPITRGTSRETLPGLPLSRLTSRETYQLLSPEIDPTVATMQGLSVSPLKAQYNIQQSANIVSGAGDNISQNLNAWLTQSVASILPDNSFGGRELFKEDTY